MDTGRAADRIAKLLLLLLLGLLFLKAPVNGEFAWSDAPRHALNGVFVKDLVAAMPWRDPAGYAYAYYAQYPALTILFYPPLFYFISAPFYAIFGFSHATALLVVGLFYAAFVLGCFSIARRWLATVPAALLAGILLCLPEIAFWGRQIMLEVPAFAFLVWSAFFFVEYLEENRPRHLYLAVFLLVLGMYTKITVGFIALAYLATIVLVRKTAALRERRLWVVALLTAVALVPLLVLTVKFGQANVQSVTGIADSAVARTSLAGWLWYGRQLPMQMGWAALLGSVAGIAFLYRRPVFVQKKTIFFLWAWFVLGYLFFSAIDLKEARHSIFILPPLLFLGALGLSKVRHHVWILSAMLAFTVWQTTVSRPVHYVDGYRQAADAIAELAPPNSTVLFSGYRDGAFVFNMRTHEERRDIATLRADKLLLRVAVRRELGVEQKDYSEAEMAQLIDDAGVHYVVAQLDFWTDLAAMRRLQNLLASSHFSEVKRIEVKANYPVSDKVLVIYRNNGEVAEGKGPIRIDLPIINRTIKAERP